MYDNKTRVRPKPNACTNQRNDKSERLEIGFKFQTIMMDVAWKRRNKIVIVNSPNAIV